jgi:hypothetical protein
LDWIVLLAGVPDKGGKSEKVKLKAKDQKSSTHKDNTSKNNLQ